MFRRNIPQLTIMLAGLVLACAAPNAAAEDLGKKRVQRMNGSWLVGDVEDLGDAYKITQGKGITVTLKKSEVKAILPLEEEAAAKSNAPAGSSENNSFRREVTDEEIQELLDGITVEAAEVVEAPEMTEPLTTDEAGVQEMLRLAGGEKSKNVLEKPHFVLVFTTTRDQANQLAARLEAVYNWVLKYMKLLNLPYVKPEHKLEIYYFATFKEFDAYSINTGGGPTGGNILGYYSPDHNRSAFFELSTMEMFDGLRAMLKDSHVSPDRKRKVQNIVNRWVEYHNMEVIQHEAGHHIHFNVGMFPREVFNDHTSYDSLPRWLVEGTTMMFEFPPTSAGASLGTVNHARLDQFDQIYGRHDKNRRLSPEQIKAFILDNRIFLEGGFIRYSLGWSLVNYFWNKKRDGLAEYMRIISTREPGVAVTYTQREKEFEDCFGRVDEKWIDAWYAYLDSLVLKKSVLPPDLSAPP